MNQNASNIDPYYIAWIIGIIAFAIALLLIFVVLSQRKHLQVQRNIRQLQEQLINAQKLENIGLMASGISHDLKNILSPISLIVENLKNELENLSPDGRQNVGGRLTDVSDFAQQGVNILNQIVQHSKKNMLGSAEDIDPGTFIDDVYRFVDTTFPKQVVVIKSLRRPLPRVKANAAQMYQVILNLCINARDAMNGKGIIRIHAERGERFGKSMLHVSVADTGSGIEQGIQKKIFEPHFSTKSDAQGAGLGLYVVNSILQKTDGAIELDSSTDPKRAGSIFHLYLPL